MYNNKLIPQANQSRRNADECESNSKSSIMPNCSLQSALSVAAARSILIIGELCCFCRSTTKLWCPWLSSFRPKLCLPFVTFLLAVQLSPTFAFSLPPSDCSFFPLWMINVSPQWEKLRQPPSFYAPEQALTKSTGAVGFSLFYGQKPAASCLWVALCAWERALGLPFPHPDKPFS
jgi:hypothetical protein